MFPSAEGGVSSQETVNFGETPLNTVAEQVVRLLNTTPLPLRFEWRHLALPLELLPPTALRTAPSAPLVSAHLGEELEPDSAAFPFAVSPPLGQLPPGEVSS